MSGASKLNPLARDKSNYISGTIKIPKTYKITKERLTLEDVSLIIRALEIGISDNHPLFEQAKQQGLFDVSV